MVKKQQSLIIARIERYLVIFVVWTMFMFLSLFRNEKNLVFVLIHYRPRVSVLVDVGDL